MVGLAVARHAAAGVDHLPELHRAHLAGPTGLLWRRAMNVIRDDADIELYTLATEHFPDDRHKQDVRGGVTLLYLEGETVITKLNETFGLFGWQFEVLDDGIYNDDEAWCRGKLTIFKRLALGQETTDGVVTSYHEVVHTASREQYGSQKIKRSRNTGLPLDIGFDKKGAATDCLKKCASLVGIGLYLWNKEEAAILKWQLSQAKRGDGADGAPAPTNGQQPTDGSGGSGGGRFNRPAGRSSGTARPAGDGALVINGVRMPEGFQQPFALVTQGKERWQCRAEQCDALVDAKAEYRVGDATKTGQYVLDRAREEAGAVLCVTHMATWYRAKQAAGQTAS